jgi:hypothetical protein
MQALNAIILLYLDESLVEYVSTEKCIGNPGFKARSYNKILDAKERISLNINSLIIGLHENTNKFAFVRKGTHPGCHGYSMWVQNRIRYKENWISRTTCHNGCT